MLHAAEPIYKEKGIMSWDVAAGAAIIIAAGGKFQSKPGGNLNYQVDVVAKNAQL
jgi:3'-phosphoadenosine 5'-phosphosulfate (PAPS) 3'-phosphatase